MHFIGMREVTLPVDLVKRIDEYLTEQANKGDSQAADLNDWLDRRVRQARYYEIRARRTRD